MLYLRSTWCAACTAIVVISCSSADPSAAASASGSVAGYAVPTAGVYSSQGSSGPIANPSSSVTVHLAASADICGAYQSGFITPNMLELVLVVENTSPTSGPGAGTYAIGAGAKASLIKSNAMCESVMDLKAESGSISLWGVARSVVVGSFDLTWPSGDHVSGMFEAPNCSGNYTSGRPGPHCGG